VEAAETQPLGNQPVQTGSGDETPDCACRARARAAQEMETGMSKRDDLIAKYADDLRTKCMVEPDMALLTKVTIGCGPAVYSADTSLVAGSDPDEVQRVKTNFLMKKLGLADGPQLTDAIIAVLNTYGQAERNKHRAVVYYMLVRHFGKEAVYA
jgi:Protein of unknown function (DUF2853)